jgi:hypothetical protein
MRKMAAATSRKSMMFLRKIPALMVTAVSGCFGSIAGLSVQAMWLKSMFPSSSPSGGMMMSATSEDTIFPKAAPMITPTARSRTFPRETNSRNSFRMLMVRPPRGR